VVVGGRAHGGPEQGRGPVRAVANHRCARAHCLCARVAGWRGIQRLSRSAVGPQCVFGWRGGGCWGPCCACRVGGRADSKQGSACWVRLSFYADHSSQTCPWMGRISFEALMLGSVALSSLGPDHVGRKRDTWRLSTTSSWCGLLACSV